MQPIRKNSIPRWLLRLAVFPCLWAWTLVRLWIPLWNSIPVNTLAVAAALFTAAALLIVGCFGLADKLLLVWNAPWKSFLLAAPFLLLGGYFDISYSMFYDEPPVLEGLPFGLSLELLCHFGNAIVFAVIALALIRAARDMRGLGRVDWKQFLVIFVCLNAVTAFYAFTSNTVYVWDNAGYWVIARTLAQEELNYQHIINILETTLTLDYNHLLAFPISLVMRVFGGSRTVFTFAVSNLYTLPALWGLTAMANGKHWSGLPLVGLFPMLGYTGLVGFVDVICCAMGVWAYLIYTSSRPAASRGVLTGALLVFTFLCRRYFVFFAASFGLAAFVVKVFFDRKKWWDFIALVCSFGLCALTFSYRFLLDKVLEAQYSDLYSAYDLGLMSDFLFFARFFGIVSLALFLLSAIVNLARKEDRPKMVLGIVQCVVCFAAFVQVQSHGQQHLLMYLPALALLAVTALSRAPQYLSALLAMSMAVYCFFPKIQPTIVTDINTVDMFPSFHFYGPERYDTAELLRLSDFIDGLSAEEPATATLLAASFTLNTETLTNLRASLNLPENKVKTTIQYHGSVDKRDPFNWNTVNSDYLIVGDPVQVHLGEDNQAVLAVLANHILNGTGPGKAYRQLPDAFHLANGVTVRIYKLERPWRVKEYHEVADPLVRMYPEYAKLYRVPSWIK